MSHNRLTLLSLALMATILCSASYARADERSPKRDLRYDLRLDLAATSIATAGWILTSALQDKMAPAGCRWCSVDSFDAWGHNNLKWSSIKTADYASHALAYGLAPALAFSLDALAANADDAIDGFWVDALVIAEAAAISSFATQIVQISAGRQRPYAHYGTGGSSGPSDNTSFYSGHTSLAFSLAVASGTVASMRGYTMAPWIWGAGLAVAATTGYLRLAADKHYMTDVIAGAAIGSAVGFALPYLFHRPKESGSDKLLLTATPSSGGGMLAVSGRW